MRTQYECNFIILRVHCTLSTETNKARTVGVNGFLVKALMVVGAILGGRFGFSLDVWRGKEF